MNLNIKNKIRLGYIVLISILIIVGLLVFRAFRNNRSIDNLISNVFLPSIKAKSQLSFMIENSGKLSNSWLYTSNRTDRLRLQRIHDEEYPELREELKLLFAQLENEKDILKLDSILLMFDETLENASSITKIISSMEDFEDDVKVEESIALLDEKVMPSVKILNGMVANLSDFEEITNTLLAKKYKSQRLLELILIIGILAGILLGLLISYITTRSIIGPIQKLKTNIMKLSSGDLTKMEAIGTKDEIGEMSDSLAEMIDVIGNLIINIKNLANSYFESSKQINTIAEQIREGASSQAVSSEEVSSSMEEMLSIIEKNAENSSMTEKITVDAVERVVKGNEAAIDAVDTMRKVVEKISIIEEITAQTNILSLNAAVEAARAGDSGKGFAVVASEVRKLAERSKLAADEITVVTKNGMVVSEETGEQLNVIVPEMEKTANLIKEINVASIEQKAGADQINEAVQKLNMVAQQNSSAAEEMLASSVKLSEQSSELMDITSYFKLGENKGAAKQLSDGDI